MLLGPVLQTAYTTRDIDRACAEMGERYGVHKFLRAGPVDVETDAGETMTLKLAHAWMGPTWLEIIQPMRGAPLYSDWLPAANSCLRLHHIGVRLPDLQAWTNMLREAERAGVHMPLSLTKNRAQRYGYLDTIEELDHYLEYLFVPDASQTMMADMPQNIPGYQIDIDRLGI